MQTENEKMVLAAPVALLAASKRARAFVGANQQAFFNLGMGVFALVVTMKNVAYRVRSQHSLLT